MAFKVSFDRWWGQGGFPLFWGSNFLFVDSFYAFLRFRSREASADAPLRLQMPMGARNAHGDRVSTILVPPCVRCLPFSRRLTFLGPKYTAFLCVLCFPWYVSRR
jgi:hypothetical protein